LKTFIIAEAGVNHNGSEDAALELVGIAALAGADAVKFQTFRADALVARGTATAEYQARATGNMDQHAMLRELELSEAAHRRLFSRCAELGIEFMSTPFDEESARFLVELGMSRIKIPSGEITNLPLLRSLVSLRKPLILSTGMATLEEVKTAVDVIRLERAALGLHPIESDDLSILHCTSNYPARMADVNLLAMQTIARATGLPVGYSDHTLGVNVSIAAVALGATIIEKHFTLGKELPGPDHSASLDLSELTRLIVGVREIEVALGHDRKEPMASELPVRQLVRRSVTTIRPILKGTVIRVDDVALLRPGHGIPPASLESVVGRRAVRDLDAGATLVWADLEVAL
jgi:N,N'-diacetyllegionaminate synthase